MSAAFRYPFHFCLKKGAVQHDHYCNIETWLFFGQGNRLGWERKEFQKWSGGAEQLDDTLAVIRQDAWEAVRASIDDGRPAIAWSPYTDKDFADWGGCW